MKKRLHNNRFIPILASWVIRLIGWSLRLKIKDEVGIFSSSSSKSQTPYLFAFWHNRILMMPYFYEKFLKNRQLVVMISTSKDGQLITNVAAKFGVSAARGSSSKKGIRAFMELVRELKKQGKDVGITPDGPRGPRYSIQPGALQLAQFSGIPLLPITYHLEKKWEMKSWDKFQIPVPFSTCHLILKKPIEVPSKSTEEDLKRISQMLQQELED